jgi:hypothetical protein
MWMKSRENAHGECKIGGNAVQHRGDAVREGERRKESGLTEKFQGSITKGRSEWRFGE